MLHLFADIQDLSLGLGVDYGKVGLQQTNASIIILTRAGGSLKYL